MPKKPPIWCGKCRTVHRDGICPHRKAFTQKRDKTQKSGRGGHKWRKLRERIFIRDKFLCQICLSKDVYTSVELHGPNHGVCDHIIPKSQGGKDDEDNLQTICQACDKKKTAEEALFPIKGGA